MKNLQPPGLGLIVLYRPRAESVDKEVRPGMIIHVYQDDHRKRTDTVQLQVFSPSGDTIRAAAWSEQGDKDTWFWPPEIQQRPAKLEKSDDTTDKKFTEGLPDFKAGKLPDKASV